MLDIGFYHPLIIHFAISLVIIGVLLHWISLTGRASFTGPAATSLLLLGTVAVVAAAWSGENAHIAVEALPGIASAVREHQLWGERTRNIVLAVAICEASALVLRRNRRARAVLLTSGLLHGWLTAEALAALGQTDAARMTLQNLQIEFPDSERLRRRLGQADGKVG
jgi:uncharacterized membrane protein